MTRSQLDAIYPGCDEKDPGFRLVDAISHHDEIEGLSPDAPARLSRLRTLFDTLSRAAGYRPISQLVQMVIDDAGYRRELMARDDFDSHVALLNLGKLVELARRFEGGEGGLDAFVEYVQYSLDGGGEEAEVLALDEESDAVKVMTVHQAKGLEFPVVFIPGLAERMFPDPRVDDPDRWDQFPEGLKGGIGSRVLLNLQSITTKIESRAG